MLCHDCATIKCEKCGKAVSAQPTTGTKHIVDLDAPPLIPDGWEIESHKKGGSFEWDPAKVALHLEPEQKEGKSLKGTELRKRLEDKPAFNANMLDWLLAHTEAIPEEWKQDGNGNTRYIYFWDTVYRTSDGSLYVRGLFWDDGRWHWGYYCLGSDFGVQDTAAFVRISLDNNCQKYQIESGMPTCYKLTTQEMTTHLG